MPYVPTEQQLHLAMRKSFPCSSLNDNRAVSYAALPWSSCMRGAQSIKLPVGYKMDVSKSLIRELSGREWRRFDAFRCLPVDAIDPACRQQVLANYDVQFYEYEAGEAHHPEPSEPPAVTVSSEVAPSTSVGGKGSSPSDQKPDEHQLAETTPLGTTVQEERLQQAPYLPSIKDYEGILALSNELAEKISEVVKV
ncbi:uncharacterized protein LOC118463969 [Anopheles albimanus]|uniref:uncharacterized protein LOC118463969 n=1 Tax=Anopheles albimanus TaxID=7167 RepID=UPI00163F1660|nr:uncharacterized protein LOC118463969 [Anopheles albimanus]